MPFWKQQVGAGTGKWHWEQPAVPCQSQAIQMSHHHSRSASNSWNTGWGRGCWEINPTGCSSLWFHRVEGAGLREGLGKEFLGPFLWEANTEGLEQLVGDSECFLKAVADIVLIQGASQPAGRSSRLDPISTARESLINAWKISGCPV